MEIAGSPSERFRIENGAWPPRLARLLLRL
jgi:hypothetical protein